MFYNEIDAKNCQWIANLADAGAIPPGRIDSRSITELQGDDCAETSHFFAGISGWPVALRLAGWPDDRAIWTGSCPCPPFSAAGKKQRCPACGGRPVPCPRRTGFFICVSCEHAWFADARHLWPEFWRLIAVCRPPIVVGEQVSGPDGLLWLAGVRGSLEILGYRVGAVDIAAGCVGAPQIRQRLFWVAVAGFPPSRHIGRSGSEIEAEWSEEAACLTGRSASGRLDSAAGGGHGRAAGPEAEKERSRAGHDASRELQVGLEGHASDSGGMGIADRSGLLTGRLASEGVGHGRSVVAASGDIDQLGNTISARLQERASDGGIQRAESGTHEGQAAELGDPWSDYRSILCGDGKYRRIPTERGLFPLAHGIPRITGPLLARLAELGHSASDSKRIIKEARSNRVTRLKGFGNAIVPQVAAEFMRAVMEMIR